MYGALYNKYAAQNVNLAPSGWHVATEEDFDELIDCILDGGEQPQHALMVEGSAANATNSSGFTGIPTPRRAPNASWTTGGEVSIWWTGNGRAISIGGESIPYWYIGYDSPAGMPVRCIKE
jgi:uncharacterized protein (TIGR02145 family)